MESKEGVPLRQAPALHANILLVWQRLTEANTLAYYKVELIMAVKSLEFRPNFIKLFWA